MSCSDCERAQALAFSRDFTVAVPIFYFRIGNGNVAVVACDKHAKEIQGLLRGEKT